MTKADGAGSVTTPGGLEIGPDWLDEDGAFAVPALATDEAEGAIICRIRTQKPPLYAANSSNSIIVVRKKSNTNSIVLIAPRLLLSLK